MRFFFHLRGKSYDVLDEEGVESTGVESVQAEALAALAELHEETRPVLPDWSGWLLEITDASGTTIAVIPLDAAALSSLAFLLGSRIDDLCALQDLPKVLSHAL
jgi:hypothetical protein